MANISAKKGITIVIILAVMGILLGVLLPTGVNQVVETQNRTATLDEGNSTVVKGPLNVTMDTVNQNPDNVTVTLQDSNTGGSQTLSDIANGSSKDATLDGETVTVHLTDVVDSDTATIKVEYPPDYGYSTGAKAIWGIFDIIIILIIFLFIVALGVKESNLNFG